MTIPKRCLQERGISIPNEVAISCMSGTTLSTLVHPTLTAVEQPVIEMARTAVILIFNKINDFFIPNETITLTSEMIVRNSTKA